jgi:integrase
MGLYKRGKIWWVQLTVNGRHPCFSTHTSSKRLAQKILDIRRAEIAEGRFPGLLKSHPPKLGEYISQYLKSRTDLHVNTHTRYEVSRRCLEKFFSATRLPDITDNQIEMYKKARLQGTTGPVGVNRDLSLLRQILDQARREGFIGKNPLADRDHFLDERKGKIQARPFTIAEEQHLLSVAKGYLRPLILLLLDTGLRPNAEALALRWRDVDFDRSMVTVISSKTPAGLRTVPMTGRLKEELLRWRKLTGPQNSQFVFFYPQDPSKHLRHVRKSWAHALKEANVPKRRLYDCRSTFCSRMYAAGIQPVLIELLMGHAGSGLIHTYAKADDDFKRDAAAKLEAFITSKMPTAENSTTSTTWVN